MCARLLSTLFTAGLVVHVIVVPTTSQISAANSAESGSFVLTLSVGQNKICGVAPCLTTESPAGSVADSVTGPEVWALPTFNTWITIVPSPPLGSTAGLVLDARGHNGF